MRNFEWSLIVASCVAVSCRGACGGAPERAPDARAVSASSARVDDEDEDEAERDRDRDHHWRVAVTIEGQGTVRSFVDGIRCERDETRQRGDCGPKLFRTKELAPPTLEAIGASGWRFSHWAASIKATDGAVGARVLADAKSRLYVSGFGYEDTGELEALTAVFERAPPNERR